MIIAQITDLHLGFDGPDKPCQNTKRLREVIAELNELKLQPDFVLLTGDLVESGASWAYKNLKTELEDLNAPYYLALGNHDHREHFAEIFTDLPLVDGFLQYTIEGGDLRVIVLDSMEEGRHGGAFCSKRVAWLDKTLSEDTDRPTLIALHHPPIETGIGWMTAKDNDAWVQRLSEVVSRYDNIVQIICGHVHRVIFKAFAGTTVSVAKAIAPQVKLDLAEINPEEPDDRILLIDSPAGYSLHHWKDGKLTTHHATAPHGRPIVRYDERHAFIIKKTLDLPED